MCNIRFIFLFILSFPLLFHAQEFPDKPTNYVTDNADVMTSEQEEKLNKKLREFENSTTNQLFVYTANSLNDNKVDDLSRTIFNTWGIGQKDKNNGILIAVFIDDHKYRIQIGLGLEKMLTSNLTQRIQDSEMKPFFRKNQYYEGIDVGVDKLIYFSGHEATLFDKIPWGILIFFYVFNAVVLVILYFVCRTMKERPKAAKVIMILGSILFIIPFLGAFISFILMIIAAVMSKGEGTGGTGNLTDNDSLLYSSRHRKNDHNSSSSSSSDFGGGGGGSSDSGGSSSDW